MALTPKLREAALLAYHAPGVTLVRCCGGYRDPSKPATSPVVTPRTANTMVVTGMAVYNEPLVPSGLTLTPDGIATARHYAMQAAA